MISEVRCRLIFLSRLELIRTAVAREVALDERTIGSQLILLCSGLARPSRCMDQCLDPNENLSVVQPREATQPTVRKRNRVNGSKVSSKVLIPPVATSRDDIQSILTGHSVACWTMHPQTHSRGSQVAE